MHRFVIFGRGRSGTTVVSDELGMHPQIAVPVEDHVSDGLEWNLLEPFSGEAAEGVTAASTHLRSNGFPLPYESWCLVHGVSNGPQSYGPYLDVLEAWGARQPGARACGFKIIDNQMLEREGLIDLLHARAYRVINVHRRNVIRHALSGLIARARGGVFNQRNYEVPEESYEIDPAEFLIAIECILRWTSHWDEEIAKRQMPSITVEYEVFLENREKFYRPIFELLEVDPVLPRDSEFTRMTPRDLSTTIRNYAQIEALAARLGLDPLLVQ